MEINRSQSPPKKFISSLSLISTNYAYRCDAKFADESVRAILTKVEQSGYFCLGSFLPLPFIKGVQPSYLDFPTDDSARVINTLAIRNLSINESDCRYIAKEDFDSLNELRHLKKGDVLLTVDGGVSIGKPCIFSFDTDYTTDSHVAILRPVSLSPLALVYLLASPLGQMQFWRAESGASGQTTVTEDDIRRFIFPKSILETIDKTIEHIESERIRIAFEREQLTHQEKQLWTKLSATFE